ncbi:MAG: Hpt domain-containing protein [Cellvibrionaceae bacterium]|nr:Hpt domain-containing protein [Cellvibrionaceae bacterium]
MNVSPLNQTLIDELKALMGADFSSLIETYMQDSQQRLAQMEVALAQGDMESLISNAHSLKGSSSNLGARQVEQSCATLVHMGRTGNYTGLRNLFDELQQHYASACQYFRTMQ